MLDSSSSGNKSKKRGRKPKGKILDYKNILNSDVESDEDPIITHLPIKLEDLNADQLIEYENRMKELGLL